MSIPMVVGHSREKDIFRSVLSRKRLVNGYVFSGMDGVGKKLFATNIGRALFCQQGQVFEPCNCEDCTLMDTGSHPDFTIIGGEGTIKIDEIRSLAETVYLTPYRGKAKVIIVDNAHTMTDQAANAFLHTLEEPGAETVFFLVTDRPSALLPTIRSRCVSVAFGRLTDEEVRHVTDGIIDPAVDIETVIEMAAGSPGRAIAIATDGIPSMEFIENRDWTELARQVNALKEKDDIRRFVNALYAHVAGLHREQMDGAYMEFANYLLEILKRLEYNVNLDITRLDLLSRSIEVFS